MSVAFKFEGYRVLLVHNQEGLWDDIHLRLVDTTCSLFAVNSAKDALALMSLTDFDIIIADADLPDASGMGLLQSAEIINTGSVRIMHQKKPDNGHRWHLILEGADALDHKYLEIYGMLSILSDQTPDNYHRTEKYIGSMFEDLQQAGTSIVFQ
jgi:DNA-binding NtrC family response regulator